ncbi:hypothetical protein M405DRAFT_811606 [Rhizopogon salebrosus TDB-379]|nr:hypothetical protein M405DRAFT_811606 [Rhizopogon salebrosus TDB-379]
MALGMLSTELSTSLKDIQPGGHGSITMYKDENERTSQRDRAAPHPSHVQRQHSSQLKTTLHLSQFLCAGYNVLVIHRQPHRRCIESDASRFYFRASVHSQMHLYNHVTSHRRHSSASIASLGPSISYMGSVAQWYAHGGRVS